MNAKTVLRGAVRVPTSKPHTQRALLLAALADGESTIHRPNVCSESNLLATAAAALGARFVEDRTDLIVRGVAGEPRRPASVLQVDGSGFALRHLVPITALAEAPCVVIGHRRLAARPIRPLLTALAAMGSRVEPADPDLVLPLVTWTSGIDGGRVAIPADETSQFASALMLAAPYAARPLRIDVTGKIVSRHYLRLTRDLMHAFGASVEIGRGMRTIDIVPGGYRARDLLIGPDVTSLFYFIAAAVVADTDIRVEDVEPDEDGLLGSAMELGTRLGVRLTHEDTALRITSGEPPSAPVLIDAIDVPTLVPALAAIASSLPGGMVLRNARHIQNHKTSRLDVVLGELARLGRVLEPVYHEGQLDGFTTCHVVPTAVDLVDSQGDHRNFMALSLAAMALERRVRVLGAETLTTSFPDFRECFRALTTEPTPARRDR